MFNVFVQKSQEAAKNLDRERLQKIEDLETEV